MPNDSVGLALRVGRKRKSDGGLARRSCWGVGNREARGDLWWNTRVALLLVRLFLCRLLTQHRALCHRPRLLRAARGALAMVQMDAGRRLAVRGVECCLDGCCWQRVSRSTLAS